MADKTAKAKTEEKPCITIGDIATFCKKKGFVYANSEVYGGNAGFFDYGPLGVELFNNIKAHWWSFFVHSRDDIVGIDGAIINNPKVWHASGHVDNFGDLILTCTKCKADQRADHFIEEALNVPAEGLSAKEVNKLIKEGNLKCPICKSDFAEVKDFNLMFQVPVGASKETTTIAYLRGELAQNIFVNFKTIMETSRVQIPFGIACIGSVFRNEIAPRDFLFRCREFHIGEFEFFIHPDQKDCPFLSDAHKKVSFSFLSRKNQEKKHREEDTTIKALIDKKICDEWHVYWLAEQFRWLDAIGIKKEALRLREHLATELSHYSSATFDIEYKFSFGTKEVAGNANRGQYDLTCHQANSKKSMEVFDESSKTKIIPRIIEPTFGLDRVFLTVLTDAYHDDKKRGNIVLHLHPRLAPYKAGVFPLVNKDRLPDIAQSLHTALKDAGLSSFYDRSGSVGRRYARADEIGIPYCVTVDFDSLGDKSVTIRDRETTEQKRVRIADVPSVIGDLVQGRKDFNSL